MSKFKLIIFIIIYSKIYNQKLLLIIKYLKNRYIIYKSFKFKFFTY